MNLKYKLNKRIIDYLFLVVIVASFISFDYAQTPSGKDIVPSKFTVGGSLRFRGELKDKFNFNDGRQDYFLSQVRVNLKWQPSAWLSFFVEAQDARVFGEDINSAPSINEDARPNVFHDNMDLHQGFADLNFNKFDFPLKLRLGRQKFNLGAMRLVASLEWVNTARVWDGVRATFGKADTRTIDIFGSRVVPVTPDRFNDYQMTGSRYFNSSFWGAYFTDKKVIANSQLEAYWLFRNDSSVDDATHTIGSRIASKINQFDLNGEAAVQFGEFGGLDHQAFMLHLEGGYTFKSLNNSRVGVAYNFGSGDDDPNDDKHKTFDNLYPLNHAYYGYMDYFSLQNIHNLEFTVNTKVGNKTKLRLAFHGFWLADLNDGWYNAGLGVLRRSNTDDIGSNVGNELDITVTHPLEILGNKFVFVGGYSRFFSGDYVKNSGNSVNPNFFFLMTKVKF